MPLLKITKSDDLAHQLEALSPSAVRRKLEIIKSLLHHRSVVVRWAAAQALGRARIGGEELLGSLQDEKNSLVLTEITESLVRCNYKQSLPLLHDLAENHRLSLVRSYSILAIADLLGSKAIPYLMGRLTKERDRRVKATLASALFAKGATKTFPDLLKSLKSKDPKIRSLVANLMYHYAPRKKRKELLGALRSALAQETLAGVKGDLQRAINEMSGGGEA